MHCRVFLFTKTKLNYFFQMYRSIRYSAACEINARCIQQNLFLSFFSFFLQKKFQCVFSISRWTISKTFSSRELDSRVEIKTAKWSTNEERRKLTNNRRRIDVFKPIPCLTMNSYIFLVYVWKRKSNNIYIYTHVYEWILNRHGKFTYLTSL